MIETLSETDKAWLAGLFEGEGYIGHTKNGVYRKDGQSSGSLQLTITQKGTATATLIHQMAGFGSVSQAVGKHRSRDIFLYRLHGSKVRRFIACLLPYMRLPHKVDQAKKALEFDDLRRRWPRKMVCVIRENGKKNWVYPGTNGHDKPRSGVLQ